METAETLRVGKKLEMEKKRKLFEAEQPRAASPGTPGSAAVEGGEPETQDSCRLQVGPAPSDLTARTAGERALRLN